jgi:hypothetical protein
VETPKGKGQTGCKRKQPVEYSLMLLESIHDADISGKSVMFNISVNIAEETIVVIIADGSFRVPVHTLDESAEMLASK